MCYYTDFVLVNIYAPNTELEQVMFFKRVANALRTPNYESTANIVVGGDFNCCMTDFDTDGGNYKPKKKSISFMESFLDEFDLVDVWRVMNPKTKKFTRCTYSPLVQRRLDYFFISCPLQSAVTEADIKSAPVRFLFILIHFLKEVEGHFIGALTQV